MKYHDQVANEDMLLCHGDSTLIPENRTNIEVVVQQQRALLGLGRRRNPSQVSAPKEKQKKKEGIRWKSEPSLTNPNPARLTFQAPRCRRPIRARGFHSACPICLSTYIDRFNSVLDNILLTSKLRIYLSKRINGLHQLIHIYDHVCFSHPPRYCG